MIIISGRPFDPQTSEIPDERGSSAGAILQAMQLSPVDYRFETSDQLKFETDLRSATVAAAVALNRSGMDFAVFRKSRCNPDFWRRTENGGFVLRSGVSPSRAIRDIYKNGPDYATECATAILIVYYKAVLDVFPDALFDSAFPDIELMNWLHVDPVFRNVAVMQEVGQTLPGDRRYFINPDVNPETPEWRGENVIELGGGKYYGHGLGIGSADTIIKELNRNRARNADESAHLLSEAGRPDFQKLFDMKKTFRG